MVFGALQLVISQLPDLSALKVRPASLRRLCPLCHGTPGLTEAGALLQHCSCGTQLMSAQVLNLL